MEIPLTPELERFVADEIADGAFQTPEELVRALLDLYREKKLAMMRRALEAAVREADQGLTMPLTDELMAEIKEEARRELEAEKFQEQNAQGVASS